MTLELVSVEIPPHIASTISRLADEGVPVAAIARALLLPSEDIRQTLHDAIDAGMILDMPKEDWPPGSRRYQRGLTADSLLNNDDRLRFACSRYFKTTRLQSAILAVLLKRHEVTKDQLHQVVEQLRSGDKDATDRKMVDVLICLLRRKLGPFDIPIKTSWGVGYLIELEHRDKAIAQLEYFMLPQIKEAA
jgi:hypothetical protein